MATGDPSASQQLSAMTDERDKARLQLSSQADEIKEFIAKAQGLSEMLAKTIDQRDRTASQLAVRTQELECSREETADAHEATATAREDTVMAREATACALEATATAHEAAVIANDAAVVANDATDVATEATATAIKQLKQANLALASSQLSLSNTSAAFSRSQVDLCVLTSDLQGLNQELIRRTTQRIALAGNPNIEELTQSNLQLLRRTEELAEANKKMKSVMANREDFIAALTHDLKNPLIGCNQVVKAMLDEHITFEEQPQYLRLILDSTNSMLRMIWNLLVTYKNEQGHLTPAPDIINLADLLKSGVDEFSFAASSKGVNIVLEAGDTGLSQIRTDQILLRRVLVNLLDNAVKFTPPKGLIQISATSDEKEIRISVRDSGVGISKEHIDHIFEQFWQSTDTVRRNSTGLGLFISKQIMHLLGGSIECNNERGTGTEFILILPSSTAIIA